MGTEGCSMAGRKRRMFSDSGPTSLVELAYIVFAKNDVVLHKERVSIGEIRTQVEKGFLLTLTQRS